MRGAPVLLVLGACSPSASDGGVAPTSSIVVEQGSITVVVALPRAAGILYGPAVGRILAADGTEVAQFAFESGWDTPPGWSWGDPTPPSSQALPEIEVQLPASGSYTFVLDEFATSGGPCGTCEAGYEGGSIEAAVDEGATVVLPQGEEAWVS